MHTALLLIRCQALCTKVVGLTSGGCVHPFFYRTFTDNGSVPVTCTVLRTTVTLSRALAISLVLDTCRT